MPTKMLARNRSRRKKDRLLVRSSGNNTLLEHSPRSSYRPEKAAPNPVRSVYFFQSVKNSLLGSDSIRFKTDKHNHDLFLAQDPDSDPDSYLSMGCMWNPENSVCRKILVQTCIYCIIIKLTDALLRIWILDPHHFSGFGSVDPCTLNNILKNSYLSR